MNWGTHGAIWCIMRFVILSVCLLSKCSVRVLEVRHLIKFPATLERAPRVRDFKEKRDELCLRLVVKTRSRLGSIKDAQRAQ